MGNLVPGLPDDLAMECLVRMHFESFLNAVLTCKKWMNEIGSRQYLRRRLMGGHSQSMVIMRHESYDYGIDDPEEEPDTTRLMLCELKTGSWSELPPIPYSINCRLAVVGFNLVVILGTFVGYNGVYTYNFVSNRWRRGMDMLEGRLSFGCASDSERLVYVVGGFENGKTRTSALAYDVAKYEWLRLPDMAAMVREGLIMKTTFQSGKLHVFFGCLGGSFSNMSVQAFDPSTWTWGPVSECLSDMGTMPGFKLAAAVGNVYVLGEEEVAVIENGKCQKIADLPVGLTGAYEMLTWNKHLVFIACTGIFQRRTMVYLFDLEFKDWSILEEAPSGLSSKVHIACISEI